MKKGSIYSIELTTRLLSLSLYSELW